MSVEVSAKTWEAMEPRERDAWIAEYVMGWEREPVEWHPGANVVWFKPDEAYCREHRQQHQTTLLATAMRFTTDVAADYLVLCRVREKFDRDQCGSFAMHLRMLFTFRLNDSYDEKGTNGFGYPPAFYQPGDYSHAAYLALQEPQP